MGGSNPGTFSVSFSSSALYPFQHEMLALLKVSSVHKPNIGWDVSVKESSPVECGFRTCLAKKLIETWHSFYELTLLSLIDGAVVNNSTS